MATSQSCPVCGGPMVESGVVDGLGLIYVCNDDSCSSHDDEHNCKACGHPTAFVWVEGEGEAGGTWERRCFDPLCTKS